MSLIDALLLDPAPFDVWFANRNGVMGNGTLNDPYDGSTQANFDSKMSSLPPNTRVHLGPGTFETIVENNVIEDVPRSTPIEHSTPVGLQTGVRTLNNSKPDGTLLYSYSSVGKAPEVSDGVWDAMLLGLVDS